MSRLLLTMLAAVALAFPIAAYGQTPGKSHVATVRITEPVKANGKPLAPGTYEVWILDERPPLNGITGTENQRVVQLVQNGQTLGTEVAEVFTADDPEFLGPGESGRGIVGTTGAAAPRTSKSVVERLKGGEFLRIAITDAGVRYLIHLPTADFSEPAPQPQSPSRIELPPPAAVQRQQPER